MIQAVTTPEHQGEFIRRLGDKPYFAATMGTHCALFAAHPASGWQFYLLPGSGALALRGGSAALCGTLPGGPKGEETEELQGFLRFLGVERLLCEEMPLSGWLAAEPLLLWELPRGGCLPLPAPPPAGLTLEEHPAMQPVSRLVFPDSEAEREAFYSLACTAQAHGIGCCRALLHSGQPVCTVGCYERSDTEAYLSAGVTAPGWRGRGLAGWLIASLANQLAAHRTVRFASTPALEVFYRRLGFTRAGVLQQYTREWEKV